MKSGIRMDSVKIGIIKKWSMPRNISEVQLFLGFANFYYRFIEKYSEVAVNLTNLMKKGQLWV